MNRPSLLHIIERLEGFVAKLPETIRRPVMQELTPLKELFLQQRAPRFVLTGSNRLPLQQVVGALFAWTPPPEAPDLLMELFRWHGMELGGRGTVSFLDARGADARTLPKIQRSCGSNRPTSFCTWPMRQSMTPNWRTWRDFSRRIRRGTRRRS